MLCITLLLALPLNRGAAQEDFDEYKRRVQQQWDRRTEEVWTGWAQRQADLERNWEAYQERVRENWREVVLPTKAEWVDYARDYRSRSVVNFDDEHPERRAGLRVEVLVPRDSRNPRAEAEERIREELNRVTDPRGSGEFLEGNLSDGRGGVLERGNVDRTARNLAGGARPVEERDPQGKEVLHYTVEVPMVPGHLERRARKWRSRVEQMAAHYRLPADLVFAVIQTESYYNPLARSHVPAFGLMQLVPRYGGKEAWEMVHGRAGEPGPEVLYDGASNIELGVAYLHKLRYTYYGKVRDDRKAELLITCAYNTGPANTNKALTSRGGSSRETSGKRKGYKKPLGATGKFAPALEVVVGLNPEELKSKLLRDLPWEETVGYLEKVSTRRKNYLAWSGGRN